MATLLSFVMQETHTPAWNWEILLPVHEPTAFLTLAVFKAPRTQQPHIGPFGGVRRQCRALEHPVLNTECRSEVRHLLPQAFFLRARY